MADTVLAVSQPTARVLDQFGAGGAAVLTAAERGRMGRLRRAEDRRDFLAAHLLVRLCAARLLGGDPAEISIVQRCGACGGPHGRPDISGHPDVAASLAHSRGVVAAAAGTAPVGIDVEALPPAPGLSAADLSAVLTAAEIQAVESAADPQRELLLRWVRKEACLKAGLVDLDGMADFHPLGQPGWAVHDWWDAEAGAVGAVVRPAGVELHLTH